MKHLMGTGEERSNSPKAKYSEDRFKCLKTGIRGDSLYDGDFNYFHYKIPFLWPLSIVLDQYLTMYLLLNTIKRPLCMESDCYSPELGAFPVQVSKSFTVCSQKFVNNKEWFH